MLASYFRQKTTTHGTQESQEYAWDTRVASWSITGLSSRWLPFLRRRSCVSKSCGVGQAAQCVGLHARVKNFYGCSRSQASARRRRSSLELRHLHVFISRYHHVASWGFLSKPCRPSAFARPRIWHACSDPKPAAIPIMASPRLLLRSTPSPIR